MDRWIKRTAASIGGNSESNEPLEKRPRAVATGCTIVTFNANSLFNRLKDTKDKAEIDRFIDAVVPNIIAVQEVRMPARAFSSSAKKNDGARRDRTKIDDCDKKNAIDKVVMDRSFPGYKKYYSLADWRYAGSMVAVRNDSPQPDWVAYTFASAERLSKSHYSTVDGSERFDSTADKTPDTMFDESQNRDGHYADGRVICMGFPSFDLLATYAANNGSNESSFERRRKWDSEIKLFLSRAAERGRPIIWVGDLNVAHTAADVTHPVFYATQCPQQHPGDSGQPGYTPNERSRFAEILSAANLVDTFRHFNPLPKASFQEDIPVHPNYTTTLPMPSSSSSSSASIDISIDDTAEVDKRRTAYVDVAGVSGAAQQSELAVIDSTESSTLSSSTISINASALETCSQKSSSTPESSFILGPNFTWRGAAGTTVAEAGRFYGKGMRIDYALVSASLVPQVESVRIYGSGKEMRGFLGSDHCPVILQLKSW